MEPINLSIVVECAECASNLTARLLECNFKEIILIDVEPCSSCLQNKNIVNSIDTSIETRLIERLAGKDANLYLEEIGREGIFIITEWSNDRGEIVSYYKGFDIASKVYKEKIKELLKASSDEG